MRPLSMAEINAVSGGDTVDFRLPFGASVTATLQPNNSTTLNFSFANGTTYSWNSGVFVTCFVAGAGVGSAVTAYSGGNAALGALVGFLTAQGCSASLTPTSSGNIDPADGDGGY